MSRIEFQSVVFFGQRSYLAWAVAVFFLPVVHSFPQCHQKSDAMNFFAVVMFHIDTPTLSQFFQLGEFGLSFAALTDLFKSVGGPGCLIVDFQSAAMEDVDTLSDDDQKETPKKRNTEKPDEQKEVEPSPKKKVKKGADAVSSTKKRPAAAKHSAKPKATPKPKGGMKRPASALDEKSIRCYRCFYKRDGTHGLKMNNRQILTVLSSSCLSLCVTVRY